jgi:hypothetical protein
MSDLEKLMWDIYGYVRDNGGAVHEGGASVAEATYLRDLVRSSGSVLIAEIGFNVGFSALAFLESSPDTKVVSFELDLRRSVELAKAYIDERYPGRHELVVGDSTVMVPKYAETIAEPMDLVFVDGGHTVEVAAADIANSRLISKSGALVVVDDLAPWFPWGEGPHEAWLAAIANGQIKPTANYVDGELVDEFVGPGDRAWGTATFA